MAKIDLKPYYEKQRLLDGNIIKSKGLVIGPKITEKKVIAFKQEFGELLQRLPEVFKFWSNKKNILDYETVEEWVDGFHFLLSIGIDKGFETTITEIDTDRYDFFTLQDLTMMIYEGDLTNTYCFEQVFKMYLTFIYKLGYTNEDIQNAYDLKNAENFKRQTNGY